MAQKNPITDMCFEELFHGSNGHSVNYKAIEEHQKQSGEDLRGKTLYGETPLNTIRQIFNHPLIAQDIRNAKTFYDLGSGIGNVAIAAGMLGVFQSINGVELFKLSHETAEYYRTVLGDVFPEVASKINFFNESFLHHDFSHADVVFTNHPIKNEYTSLLKALEEKFQNLKKGSLVIYVIHDLTNKENFEHVFSQTLPFSWGKATAYCYRKTH